MLHTVNVGTIPLEFGEHIPSGTMAYSTFGTLSEQKDNIVLIYHGLTGGSLVGQEPNSEPLQGSTADSAHKPSGNSDAVLLPPPTEPWWGEVVRTEGWVDTKKWFVICFNCLGSCYGSTGPVGYRNRFNKPFPRITVRDQAAATLKALKALNIHKVHAVIGASLGGMQALETLIMNPHITKRAWLGAVGVRATAEQIGSQLTQIQAIKNDPKYQQGLYAEDDGPVSGLGLAREIGHITYRGVGELDSRFQNLTQNTEPVVNDEGKFLVGNYLKNRADSLVRRFDANSYITLTDSLNTHDICRPSGVLPTRDSHRASFTSERVEVLRGTFVNAATVVNFKGDKLWPLPLQKELVSLFRTSATEMVPESFPSNHIAISERVVTVDTLNGHDGFLTEQRTVGETIRELIER